MGRSESEVIGRMMPRFASPRHDAPPRRPATTPRHDAPPRRPATTPRHDAPPRRPATTPRHRKRGPSRGPPSRTVGRCSRLPSQAASTARQGAAVCAAFMDWALASPTRVPVDTSQGDGCPRNGHTGTLGGSVVTLGGLACVEGMPACPRELGGRPPGLARATTWPGAGPGARPRPRSMNGMTARGRIVSRRRGDGTGSCPAR
jgi:hypothetical protein